MVKKKEKSIKYNSAEKKSMFSNDFVHSRNIFSMDKAREKLLGKGFIMEKYDSKSNEHIYEFTPKFFKGKYSSLDEESQLFIIFMSVIHLIDFVDKKWIKGNSVHNVDVLLYLSKFHSMMSMSYDMSYYISQMADGMKRESKSK